jgi:hypothetical protein
MRKSHYSKKFFTWQCSLSKLSEKEANPDPFNFIDFLIFHHFDAEPQQLPM